MDTGEPTVIHSSSVGSYVRYLTTTVDGQPMVTVARHGRLSQLQDQRTSRVFPDDECSRIRAAIESIPEDIFLEREGGREIRNFDALLADDLPDYEFEHAGDGGRNPACKLWKEEGFDHSVDLYHPEKRIAIEVEKSERKRVSDDVLKFIKGGKTQRGNRKKIAFGCLIVPVNYRGNGNLFESSLTTLDFMRSILFVEDVAVLGYTDPRWP